MFRNMASPLTECPRSDAWADVLLRGICLLPDGDIWPKPKPSLLYRAPAPPPPPASQPAGHTHLVSTVHWSWDTRDSFWFVR